jgi:hypothetical protein
MEPRAEAVKRQSRKSIVTISIMVPIALLHFVIGKSYTGAFPDFVNGYLIDILLPFGLYFLLSPQDAVRPVLRSWWVKALPVLAIGYGVETAQLFGVPIFGRTFDPLDYLAYTVGVILAVIVDKMVFPRLFSFWVPAPEK